VLGRGVGASPSLAESDVLRLFRKPVEKRRAALVPHVPTARVEEVATGPSACILATTESYVDVCLYRAAYQPTTVIDGRA
jgi:hypothetical protein